MRINNIQKNISFDSRCKAIKNGQNVVHTINTELPHARLSLHNKIFLKILNRNLYDEDDKHNRLISYVNNTVDEFISLRDTFDKTNGNLFEFVQKYKVGNCWEDSNLAALILSYNGYKNVYLAEMEKNDEIVDHIVCIYNKDDSPIYNELYIKNNKTIVLDPWAGIVDFVGNYFKKINDKFIADALMFPYKGKFNFIDIRKTMIDNDTKKLLDTSFPKMKLKNIK